LTGGIGGWPGWLGWRSSGVPSATFRQWLSDVLVKRQGGPGDVQPLLLDLRRKRVNDLSRPSCRR